MVLTSRQPVLGRVPRRSNALINASCEIGNLKYPQLSYGWGWGVEYCFDFLLSFAPFKLMFLASTKPGDSTAAAFLRRLRLLTAGEFALFPCQAMLPSSC